MKAEALNIANKYIPCSYVHTLVIGSGAAGLNAAVQLHANGITDLMVLTEGLDKGTSINTGSDKQTYYKLGMYGEEQDSPASLAESYFEGGSMHGDLALVEAALSPRAFLNLVNLGVPFPRDKYGQFVGYKTDHDPLQRATSVGPYTSREMCRVLIREVERRSIEVREERVVVSLPVIDEGKEKRVVGAVVIDREKPVDECIEVYLAENVVFATGGPGGLYRTSVYPGVHTGGIGLALLAGAKAQSLPESQYGMASIKFRWNVSGTYMQVIPRFISTAEDGKSDEQEFLRPYFMDAGEMNSAIFLKGYQWPFDPRKVVGGSSIIDILVYIETVIKGRRVFLDYRSNGEGFDFDSLSEDARSYLENSDALLDAPIKRLAKMNQPAIDLYADHKIDITKEPLEIAVCAQHNNGGLAGNEWWESANIKHLFPVGEVNGSHGVYRPGGSALNSGQVAGFRAAEFIANMYAEETLNEQWAMTAVIDEVGWITNYMDICAHNSAGSWQESRNEFKARMSKYGAHIRSGNDLKNAIDEAWKQWKKLFGDGCSFGSSSELSEVLRNLQLCFAHAVYLETTLFAIESGVGSRGSALVLDEGGEAVHEALGGEWSFASEDPEFREKVLETVVSDGKVTNEWIPRRPIPECDAWFETAWAEFREGKIY